MNFKPIVVASGSAIRKQLLEGAGLTVEVVPARIDERAIEAKLAASSPEMTVIDMAVELALQKAMEVSERRPGALVIGCDQMLEHDGDVLHKAANRDEARAKLKRLRGQTHFLKSGMVLIKDGLKLYKCEAIAELTMWDFSDAFLENYLDRAGVAVTRSVGAYELEGLGAQLFHAIDGDYFTILGLPVLPLLDMLRREGAIPS